MLTIKGKHNDIRVMLSDWTELDDETHKQLLSFANFAPFEGADIVVMPDCHAGKGCCVGTTISDAKVVVPALVGVDIGCGMLVQELPKPVDNFELFDATVRREVPLGFETRSSATLAIRTSNDYRFGLDITALCHKIGMKDDYAFRSLGTLGGGNHFIEISSFNKQQWLVIHSGSRNLGLQVCNYHQKKAETLCAERGEHIPLGMAYLTGNDAKEYLADMRIAQEYAERNREEINRAICDAVFGKDDRLDPSHCTHNYIDDTGCVRKGAIAARDGQTCVVPLNMRDGIIFGMGKNNPLWNYSAPHGAGRSKSRSAAKRELSLEDFQNTMKGVWSSSVSQDTLDEAPEAYKPVDTILKVISETVAIGFIAKPVYNLKAGRQERKR